MTAGSTDQSNRRNADSFIYDWNTKFPFNLISCCNKILCRLLDLTVDFLLTIFQICIDTIQKADTDRNSTHIQIFLFDHFICFIYFNSINHGYSPY